MLYYRFGDVFGEFPFHGKPHPVSVCSVDRVEGMLMDYENEELLEGLVQCDVCNIFDLTSNIIVCHTCRNRKVCSVCWPAHQARYRYQHAWDPLGALERSLGGEHAVDAKRILRRVHEPEHGRG
jgi:hypothetical protein